MFVALLCQWEKCLLSRMGTVGYGIFCSRLNDLVDTGLFCPVFGYFSLYLFLCHPGSTGFIN